MISPSTSLEENMFSIMKIIDLFIHLLFHCYFFIVIILSDFSL